MIDPSCPTFPLLQEIGIYPHHGINISLSALHSRDSCGVGEFYDLIPLIDWCSKLKLDIIQLLPLNNSEQDPSPYNAISSCALNFIHLSLHKLPHLELFPDAIPLMEPLKQLSKSQRIPYREVLSQKLLYLRTYFSHAGDHLINTPEYLHFKALNGWVTPYALFHALKDSLGHIPKTPLFEASELYAKEISFYTALQYLCYHQLKEVRAYANSHGIRLMGDIPILISPDSADVWEHPELFDINLSAGAPPDEYNADGQYWGFPLFRWDVLRKTDFAFWKQRLQYAAHFFDIYRIDHIVGFFRIWTIPLGRPSTEGYFLPSDELTWEAQGRELLQMMLAASPMLPIGEDLGSIPPIVPPILRSLGICSTKVMRWTRRWEGDLSFIPPEEYPPLSLTCVSTHDSPTLQQWWAQFPYEAEIFAKEKGWIYTKELSAQQREEILLSSHKTASLFHINLLQEYLALFPDLVWPNPDDERINVPGTILPTNWTYRFRPPLEEIISHEGLASAILRCTHNNSLL